MTAHRADAGGDAPPRLCRDAAVLLPGHSQEDRLAVQAAASLPPPPLALACHSAVRAIEPSGAVCPGRASHARAARPSADCAAARPAPAPRLLPGQPDQDPHDRARVLPHPLRGAADPSAREQRSAEDRVCTAGLRNPAQVVSQWPELRQTMARVRAALLPVRAGLRELQGLAGACGERPARAPPSEAAVDLARRAVGAALGLDRRAVGEHHPSSPLRHRIVQAVLRQSHDTDTHVGAWLKYGAPMGIVQEVAPGGHFPLAPSPAVLSPEELEGVFEYGGNHGSFQATFDDEPVPPTHALIREYLEKGFGTEFPSRADARHHGRTYPAPLGNISKRRRTGVWKHRIIQDLKVNCVNSAASTWERVVLPRGIDHAVDLANLSSSENHVEVVVLDFVDAFMVVPLHEDEKPYNCAEVPGLRGPGSMPYIVWNVLGFGGKSNPLVYSRFGSFAARTAQAVASADAFGLQLYVDDPVMTAAGPPTACELEFDLVLLWWLVLGLRLAWSKGAHAGGKAAALAPGAPCPAPVACHQWLGIAYATWAGCSVMALTSEFVDAFLESLQPFAGGAPSAPLAAARSITGKGSRVAQVVPTAAPFAAMLWAALTASLRAVEEGRPEAQPGHVAVARFRTAARWFLALLSEPTDLERAGQPWQPRGQEFCVFPLQRMVRPAPDAQALPPAPVLATFDASPWGGGGILWRAAEPVEYFVVTWDSAILALFEAEAGVSRWQSLWEFVTLLVCLLLWGRHAVDHVLTIQGDNIAALQDGLAMKGRGHMLDVAREIAWRKARYSWTFTTAHIPAELNDDADALSRLTAEPPKKLPERLHSVPRASAPSWHQAFQAMRPP